MDADAETNGPWITENFLNMHGQLLFGKNAKISFLFNHSVEKKTGYYICIRIELDRCILPYRAISSEQTKHLNKSLEP